MNSYILSLLFLSFFGSLNLSQSLPEHTHSEDDLEAQVETVEGDFTYANSSDPRSKRQNKKECWRWCERINDCRYDGCHYDMRTLHCYPSAWHAQNYPVIYSGTAYTPQRSSICVNFGGYSHEAADGYYFHQEPIWLGGFTVRTDKWISHMWNAGDINVYQSARTDVKIFYKIIFQYDAHYMLRMMFAEIGNKLRGQIIKFNYLWVIENKFDVGTGFGAKYKAGEFYYYPIVSNNRRHISISGHSGILGPFTAVEVFNLLPFSLAIVNGLCLTHFHTCTRWCNDAGACNRHWECYYDHVQRHCTPKSHHEITCRRVGGDQARCKELGCNYCCAKLKCQATWESMNNCNDGCLKHCKNQIECLKDSGECVYNPQTNQCTEKPYDKDKCPTYETLKDSLYTEVHLNNCPMDKIRDCVRIPYGINLGGRAYTDDGGATYITDFYPIHKEPYISDIDVCLPTVYGATKRNRYIFYTFRRLYHKQCFALPIPEDGDYTLVVKFYEPGFLFDWKVGRVFDMLLNDIPVKENINIYAAVGVKARYEIVQLFQVRDNVRRVDANGKSDKIKGTRVHLRFVKKTSTNYDWPFVSAIQVFRTRKCTNDLNREQCFQAGCFHDIRDKTCELRPEIICDDHKQKYCDPIGGITRQATTTRRPLAFGCQLPDQPEWPEIF